MLGNLANSNAQDSVKAAETVQEKKKYNELQEEIDALDSRVSDNTTAIDNLESDVSDLDDRVSAVEDNKTFDEVNTDRINPITGTAVEIPNIDSDNIDAVNISTSTLTVNGTDFDDVRQDAATAKANADSAVQTADTALSSAETAQEMVNDLERSISRSVTTQGINADSAAITNTVNAGQVVTSDLTAAGAEINTLYTSKIVAKDAISPIQDEPYTTITIPKGVTASFKGEHKTLNDVIYEWRITVQDGSVVFKQDADQIIRDISFDKSTGNTKIRVNRVYGEVEYISTVVDGTGPITNEPMGNAYTDYVFAPQKESGVLYKGYADDTAVIEIPAIIHAYAIQADEQRFERETVDTIRINNSIELPENWGTGVVTTYSTGNKGEYLAVDEKDGVTKPTWKEAVQTDLGSVSYSDSLVSETTLATYKGIAEARHDEVILVSQFSDLNVLATSHHWKLVNGVYHPDEDCKVMVNDQVYYFEADDNLQGFSQNGGQLYIVGEDAEGTQKISSVDYPQSITFYALPSDRTYPITELGNNTTVHGEITATCFKGNVLGNVTGNADTATNAVCFDGKTYAEAKADILSGKASCATIADLATNATCFDGKTYAEVCADILSGNAATATNANNADNFNNMDYATVKADILSGCAADSDKFNGKDYATACADILKGKACTSCLADCACTVKRATSSSSSAIPVVLTDAATAVNNGQILVDSDNKLTYTPSTDTLCAGNVEATTDVKAANVCGSSLVKGAAVCSTGDLNVDGCAYITGDLTVQGTITTTHSEEVVTPSENIILRDGATTPIASGCYSGMTITNYDGQNNNLEVGVDNEGTLKIGTAANNMEAVATRTCSACMESCYVAKWDATDKQLETKGVSCTHDLCVNGSATVTGTLTADLTGTADNATCFNGKTYAQAKADILSGCAADSAKLGNKDASCYIDNSEVSQAKAGHLCIGLPSACTSTSAGCGGICLNCNGAIELFHTKPNILFHYNKYCGSYSTSFANNNKGTLAITVNDGDGCTAATTSNTFDFCSDGTFKGATNICSTNLYQDGSKVIDTSSTSQTKAGNLCIGAPAACTTTSAGGTGVMNSTAGGLILYATGNLPYIHFHYNKYCGEFSTRIANTKGRLAITVNDGDGCTAAETTNIYDFYSNGTFTGARTICASTNIYSAGCPVVTTGNIATVAPGYNCTGTSNYVVTTMVCCACHAKSIDRTACCNNYNWHIPLTYSNTTDCCTTYVVSCGCPLTFNPATGILSAYRVCQCYDSFHTLVGNPNGATRYMEIKLVSSYPAMPSNFNAHLDFDVYTNRVEMDVRATGDGAVVSRASRTTDYGITQYLPGAFDSTNNTITLYVKFTGYRNIQVTSTTPIYSIDVLTTAPTGTFVDIPIAGATSCINTASSNAEFPLVFSTCKQTPASGSLTLYNDSANNLMYNPGTNTLTACCVQSTYRVCVGYATGCTSTVTGVAGVITTCSGTMELYSANPFIDFHVNNTCADCSHRIIANNGYLRVVATNATGCTAATQDAEFDFCSDGTFTSRNNKYCCNFYDGITWTKSDNSGYPTFRVVADITGWWDTCGTTACCPFTGFYGEITSGRFNGCGYNGVATEQISAFYSYRRVCADPLVADKNRYLLDFSYLPDDRVGTVAHVVPQVLCCGTKKYLVLKMNTSFVYCFSGAMNNIDPSFFTTEYKYTSSTALPSGWTLLRDGDELIRPGKIECAVAADSATNATTATSATTATNSTCFGGCTYAQAKADILAGTAKNSTCFGGCTYAQAKTDILSGVTKNSQFVLSGCTLTITM